ncbi:MAG: hypothetical protein ACE5KW_05135 [Dehalococcoidia bacterium]
MFELLKRRRWPIVLGLALVALVAFGACDDDGEEEVPTPTTAPAVEAEELTVTLAEVDGSGVTGSATLSSTDGGTEVTVTVDGGLTEGSHANHLHHGTCDEQGEIHVTLDELQASADDDATATTTDFPEEDPDPELSHFEMGHYLAVHAAEGDVISCGNVVSGS